MLLQCMQNGSFLSLVAAHMQPVSMTCMSLICKLWSGQDQHSKVMHQLQELDMLA
jgi:hypothetical protein